MDSQAAKDLHDHVDNCEACDKATRIEEMCEEGRELAYSMRDRPKEVVTV